MRISDWSSDVCSSDLGRVAESPRRWFWAIQAVLLTHPLLDALTVYGTQLLWPLPLRPVMWSSVFIIDPLYTVWLLLACVRSEEHTSELQSLMRISYAVFCLKKKKHHE